MQCKSPRGHGLVGRTICRFGWLSSLIVMMVLLVVVLAVVLVVVLALALALLLLLLLLLSFVMLPLSRL